MNKWNTEYFKYLIRRFKTSDVVNIPSGKLFVESCDSDLYNIIYVGKESFKKGWRAYYKAKDTMWDFVNFHGVVVMNDNIIWKRVHFINTMIHELGHGIALPHVPEGSKKSEFMWWGDFGCEYEEKICKFQDYDFETFIEPFPGIPMSREREHKIFMEKVRYKDTYRLIGGGNIPP